MTDLPVCVLLTVVLESWPRANHAWFRSSPIHCWPLCRVGRQFVGQLKRLWSRERWPSPEGTVKLPTESGALPRQKQEPDALASSEENGKFWRTEHITAYHERYQFPLRAGGKGSNYAELPQYLTQAGFSAVQGLEEQADFVYANAQEWWDSKWTRGTRYSLEQMAPEVLAQFKEEVFARLAQEAQVDGVHETLRFQYLLAEKRA